VVTTWPPGRRAGIQGGADEEGRMTRGTGTFIVSAGAPFGRDPIWD
jgi:hypothetical protein